MIRRTTWYFIGIFAVLVAMVVLIPKWQQGHPQPTPTAPPVNPEIVPLSQGKITEISVTSTEGKSISLQAKDNNQWSVVDTGGLVWNADQVNTAANSLVNGRVLNQLSSQPPASSMGLDKPTSTIQVKLDNGSTKTIKVGSVTPTGDAYYIQVDNNPAVVVTKSIVDQLVSLITAGTPPVTPTPEGSPTAAQ